MSELSNSCETRQSNQFNHSHLQGNSLSSSIEVIGETPNTSTEARRNLLNPVTGPRPEKCKPLKSNFTEQVPLGANCVTSKTTNATEPGLSGALPFTIALRPYDDTKLASGNCNLLDSFEAQAYARVVSAAVVASVSVASSSASAIDALPNAKFSQDSPQEDLESFARIASSQGPKRRHMLPQATNEESRPIVSTLQHPESPNSRKRPYIYAYDEDDGKNEISISGNLELVKSRSLESMWERSSFESSRRPSSNPVGPSIHKFSLRKRSASGRKRSLAPKRFYRSRSVTSVGHSHRAERNKRKNRSAVRSLMHGADHYRGSNVNSSPYNGLSAQKSGIGLGSSISTSDPSAEDTECAAIIKAVKDCVTEYNIRNPSPPPSDVDKREPILPAIMRPINPDIRYITPDTLCSLMTGDFKHAVSGFHIIDCRFDYEYDGGHIRNAINVSEPHDIVSRFFRQVPAEKALRTCLIFHCEFSQNRAPKM